MPHAVAAGHRLTAEAAADVLSAGGSAVDAAIAGAFMACVAEPVLAGLMGGAFLMVAEPGGTTRLLDGFTDTPSARRAPGEADTRKVEADFGDATQRFHIGAGTIAVPGLGPLIAEAHARYGRVPLRELAGSAARAAREGVVLSPFQARLAQIVEPILTADPASRARCCHGDGRLLGPGALRRDAELADLIEVVGHEGTALLGPGEAGQGLAALAAEGGHLRMADLAAYRPAWRTPLAWRRGGAEIALNPAPALGGGMVAFTLGLLPPRQDARQTAAILTLVAEARAEAGDAATLLAEPELRRWQTRVRDHAPARRGTTHISVVDGQGLGAALTLSNGEGCGLMIPGTGVMPNNMLGEEDLVGPDLAWTPGRRLASMMCPMAMRWPDGRLAMLGSGGSNRIRTALAQVAARLSDGQEALAHAIDAPRIHVEHGAPPDIEAEDRAEAEVAALREAWPEARVWGERSMFFGGVHAVRSGPGAAEAHGDPRRDGVGLVG